MREVRTALGSAARQYKFHTLPDEESLFHYHIFSTELDPMTAGMNKDAYMAATRATLRKHAGLWFNNETYIISRPAELGRAGDAIGSAHAQSRSSAGLPFLRGGVDAGDAGATRQRVFGGILLLLHG